MVELSFVRVVLFCGIGLLFLSLGLRQFVAVEFVQLLRGVRRETGANREDQIHVFLAQLRALGFHPAGNGFLSIGLVLEALVLGGFAKRFGFRREFIPEFPLAFRGRDPFGVREVEHLLGFGLFGL